MGTVVPCCQTEGLHMLFKRDEKKFWRKEMRTSSFSTSTGNPLGPAAFLVFWWRSAHLTMPLFTVTFQLPSLSPGDMSSLSWGGISASDLFGFCIITDGMELLALRRVASSLYWQFSAHPILPLGSWMISSFPALCLFSWCQNPCWPPNKAVSTSSSAMQHQCLFALLTKESNFF